MKITYFEIENFTDTHSTDCFNMDILQSHTRFSEAQALQMLCLKSLDVRASSIVHYLDNPNHGLQAILLVPDIYAGADMPSRAVD